MSPDEVLLDPQHKTLFYDLCERNGLDPENSEYQIVFKEAVSMLVTRLIKMEERQEEMETSLGVLRQSLRSLESRVDSDGDDDLDDDDEGEFDDDDDDWDDDEEDDDDWDDDDWDEDDDDED